VAEWLKAADC